MTGVGSALLRLTRRPPPRNPTSARHIIQNVSRYLSGLGILVTINGGGP
jgi:hypothetical protein